MSFLTANRLHNQQLVNSRFTTPRDLMDHMLAIQGQDYYGAKWAVGQRLITSSNLGVEAAFTDRSLVRTWALRGTLHFVRSSDVRWLVSLIAGRVIAGNLRRYGQLGLDEATLIRSNDVLVQSVEDGQTKTRKELFAHLNHQGISTEGQRGVYMLQRASLDGLICQGAAIRSQPTFFSPDLLAKSKPLERKEALRELARRYFISRGPATVHDFSWWSGMNMDTARRGLEYARAELDYLDVGGTIYWFAGDVHAEPRNSPVVHLLPAFDEYLLSYQDRSAQLDPVNSKSVYLSNGFAMTVVLDGQVIGTWKRTIKKETIEITPVISKGLNDAQHQAMKAAFERYGSYYHLPIKYNE